MSNAEKDEREFKNEQRNRDILTERPGDKDLRERLLYYSQETCPHDSLSPKVIKGACLDCTTEFVERELAELHFEKQHLLAVCAELRNANLAAEAAAFEKAKREAYEHGLIVGADMALRDCTIEASCMTATSNDELAMRFSRRKAEDIVRAELSDAAKEK